ncbi:hypothetical protein FDG2_0545 [Candidatus Protofrankia californiensis]|uniref:Uncharacterized protein n=1 Tax=Candidatus Protofrankia californiensis TaxID=1839754 RepID=A0A1C3NTS4_9ACTN|nr:hypothetical protein FDG2_0545 [Candidatus Protofrankia californiensis]
MPDAVFTANTIEISRTLAQAPADVIDSADSSTNTGRQHGTNRVSATNTARSAMTAHAACSASVTRSRRHRAPSLPHNVRIRGRVRRDDEHGRGLAIVELVTVGLHDSPRGVHRLLEQR